MQGTRGRNGQKTSILEVARHIGVSHSTVSRALAGDPRITAGTVERVRRAASELGYRPNRLASGLKRGQSPIIGILNFTITQSFYALIIREFESLTRSHGLASVVCDTGWDDETELAALEFLLELPVRGILLVGDRRRAATANGLLAEVWRAGTPVATISGAVPGTDIPRVSVDNEEVGYLATRHLLDGGHRRIAHVMASLPIEESSSGSPGGRLEGYRRALREAGLSADPALVTRIDEISRTAAERILGQLLDLDDPPTGLFAFRDEVALAIMGAAQARGIHVPQDLAIIGVDDLPVGSLISPSLTTLRQPVDQMVTLALDSLTRPEQASPLTLLEPSLIVRESSVSLRS